MTITEYSGVLQQGGDEARLELPDERGACFEADVAEVNEGFLKLGEGEGEPV